MTFTSRWNRMVTDWHASRITEAPRKPFLEPAPVAPVAVVAVADPEPPIPASYTPHEPSLSGADLAEYSTLAASLGITTCSQLIQDKLYACVRDLGLRCYTASQVTRYLDRKLGTDWLWYGLRQADTDHLKGWISHNGDARDVAYADTPYTGTVPLPVLLTVEKIAKAVPEVYFYVSGQKQPQGDPFLRVTARGINSVIVERWDEPGYREK